MVRYVGLLFYMLQYVSRNPCCNMKALIASRLSLVKTVSSESFVCMRRRASIVTGKAVTWNDANTRRDRETVFSMFIYFLSPNVSVHRRRLVRRTVERLVGSLFHRLFLASLFQIVSAWFVTFVFQWWRVRRARGCYIFPDPTSAFRFGEAL